jgi:hypothetical protein
MRLAYDIFVRNIVRKNNSKNKNSLKHKVSSHFIMAEKEGFEHF